MRRRTLLGGTAAAAVAGLAACGPAPQDPTGGPGEGGDGASVTWWDHFSPLQELHEQVFAGAKESDGIAVEHTVHQTAKMGQALLLAKQSEQLPDVHSNVGLELPLRQLIEDGWYQPLELTPEAEKLIPEEARIEGVTTFDGKLYTFPIFNFRQYWAATWFNADLLGKAGLDPAAPPATYDEFREACRKVKDADGEANGWINNLGAPDRIAEQVHYLAQAAGFEGNGGTLYRTGEIAVDDDIYVNLIEFLHSLQVDKLVVEGQFDDKTARTRWAAGQSAFYLDGPWCVGAVKKDAESFLPSVDVAPMLVPEPGQQVTAYRGAAGGAFFVSGSSQNNEAASKVMARMLQPEYGQGLAEYQDQPPADLAAVERADVHPAYAKVIKLYGEACFLAPQAVVRDPEVSKVTAKIPKPKPDIGEIVQGLFSGQLTDVRAALKDLADRNRKARDKAFAEARKSGIDLDESVFAFSNWEPRKDYTQEMYQ